MGTPARRDELLDETPDELAEIVQRANDALSERGTGFSREESLTRARAAVDAIRSRKP